MNNQELAKQLVAMAKELTSEDGEGEEGSMRKSSRRRLGRTITSGKLDLDPTWELPDGSTDYEEGDVSDVQEYIDNNTDNLQAAAYKFQEALIDMADDLQWTLSKASINALKQQYKTFRKLTSETAKILNLRYLS